MKKFISLLMVCLLIAAIGSGCSNNRGSKEKSKPAGSVQSAAVQTSKDKDTTDDQKFLSAADGEEQLTLDNDIDMDQDFEDIDSILDDKDLLADIPDKVELK